MHSEHSILIIIFVILSLLLGALIKSLPKLFPPPYSVVLLLSGLAIGFYGRSTDIQAQTPALESALQYLAAIDPHLILLLFLPTLIFESAFSIESHLFKRLFNQILLLAVPGILMATALTAVTAYYLFPWQWSWTICFLFGALISATDPVAVVSLLKEVSSRKRLETLIEGESLLNDGAAIVLFTLFYSLASNSGESYPSLLSISGTFVSVTLFGLLIGLTVGGLILFWIGRLFNQALIEITLTISGAYIAYFIAENIFHVSGVMAVVALGLLLSSHGRTIISPEVAGFLHHFWQMMAHIANTLIFILVGIIIASRIRLDVTEWWITLAGLYIAIQFIRALMVCTLMPILKRIGIGLSKDKSIILIWGGLRGAVSLALALMIAQDTLLSKEIGDQILFLTAGIVVLTIVINASTMTLLLKHLGLDKLPAAKQASLDKAQITIKQRLVNELPNLHKDEFLQRANWAVLSAPLGAISTHQEVAESDLNVAFRRRLLETERQFYWTQFQKGALTGAATNKLVSAVETTLDGTPEIAPRNSLNNILKAPFYTRFFNKVDCLNQLLVYLSFEKLALSYDIARGFTQAQQEIEQYVQTLAPSLREAALVRQDIAINKKQARHYIDQIRLNFPELSYRLETHSANQLMINLQRAYLKDLIEQGVLDESEGSKLTKQFEYKLAKLRPQTYKVNAQKISKQIAAMPWAKEITGTTLAALGKLAHRQIYMAGELIYKEKNACKSIALILHGQVSVICTLHERVIETNALLACHALTSGQFKNSAKALTPVDLVWFDIEKLQKIIEQDLHFAEVFATQLALQVDS